MDLEPWSLELCSCFSTCRKSIFPFFLAWISSILVTRKLGRAKLIFSIAVFYLLSVFSTAVCFYFMWKMIRITQNSKSYGVGLSHTTHSEMYRGLFYSNTEAQDWALKWLALSLASVMLWLSLFTLESAARTFTRHQFDIEGNWGEDYCTTLFCHCCSLYQVHMEMHAQEEFMAEVGEKGEIGRVWKNF